MECICKRCGYTTNRTANIRTHLDRKNKCNDDNNCGISCEDLLKEFEKDTTSFKYECKICNSKFKNRQGLAYHKTVGCKITPNTELKNNIAEKKEEEDEKDKRIKELEDELNKIKNTVINYGTINANTNNTNITNNITIVYDFGQEEIGYIKENPDFLKECLIDIPTGLRKVVSKIYFDKDHPENNTITMKNIKLNQVMIREGGEWMQRSTQETIPKMVKKSKRILHEHYCNDIPENDQIDEIDPKLSYFNDLSIPTTTAYKTAVSMVKSELSNYNFKDVKK